MQGIILCAGAGERLRPLTLETPKPLLMVGDRTILEHTLDHLDSLGFTKIAINIHYKKESFFEFMRRYTSIVDKVTGRTEIWYKNINIVLSVENEPLGTAGAVKKIIGEGKITADNFFVIYGDVISYYDHNFSGAMHLAQRALATILYHERQINSSLQRNAWGQVYHFQEHPMVKTNSDIYWFNKDIISYISDGFCDFPENVFPKLPLHRFYAFPHVGYRIAIDTPERLELARKDHNEKPRY